MDPPPNPSDLLQMGANLAPGRALWQRLVRDVHVLGATRRRRSAAASREPSIPKSGQGEPNKHEEHLGLNTVGLESWFEHFRNTFEQG